MILVGLVLLLIQAIAEVVKLVATLRGVADDLAVLETDAPVRIE